jgi:phosphoserine phosphatase RsbU/P
MSARQKKQRGRPGYWRRYAAGMGSKDLRSLIDRDAPRVYSVLLRDRARPDARARGAKAFFADTRLLFESISEKLPPARRLVFGLALLAGVLAFARLEIALVPGLSAGPRLFTLLAVGGLLFLLAVELVDRVLVRDELEVARQLQSDLLPKSPPEIPSWLVAHSWRTANDIGGDYHRCEPLPDGRWAIVVADASGHGMAAGLLMAITDTAWRTAIELDPRPDAVAAVVHRALLRTGDRRAFVTLFYGLLDPATGELEFVSAGHPSPIVRRADGALEEPAQGALPLGMRAGSRPSRGHLRLAPGDLMVIATDGLFEALDGAERAFGWERLRQEVARPGGGAQNVHDRLRDAVERHAGDAPASDDRTLVVLERLAAPPSGA